MAYFNHAFTKMFMGTQLSADNPNANLTDGFIDTAGIHISSLSVTGKANADLNYGPGTFGFFDPKTWESVDATYFSSHTCCPLVLASASLMSKDKVGSYHGGYQESN